MSEAATCVNTARLLTTYQSFEEIRQMAAREYKRHPDDPANIGWSQTRPYKIWVLMLQRCNVPTNRNWPSYGGRGVRVSERWHRFSSFWGDMGPTYREGLTLDRIDNAGNYETGNCRWATSQEQANNRRNAVRIETPHGLLSIREIADMAGLSFTCVKLRVLRGYTPEQLFLPADKHQRLSSGGRLRRSLVSQSTRRAG